MRNPFRSARFHPDFPLYFLHIPKTGGTSVHKFLVSGFAWGEVCPARLWDDMAPVPSEKTKSYRCYSGHFMDCLEPYLGRDLQTVTVLRDPVERSISHYAHVRRDRAHPFHALAQRQSLLEFCTDPQTRHMIENVQSAYLALRMNAPVERMMSTRADDAARLGLASAFEREMAGRQDERQLLSAALRRLDSCLAVGTTERLDDSLQIFAEILGGPAGDVPFKNKSANRPAQIDAATIHAIRRLTTVDAIIYEEAKARLDSALTRHTPRPSRTQEPMPQSNARPRPSVLVVDDEPLAAAMATETLRDLGCEAIYVSDGLAAIDALRGGDARQGGIDILFTDVVMPAMNGFTLAEIAKRRQPALKVIYATGDGDRAMRLKGAAQTLHGPIIEKPYSSLELESAISASWL